MPDHDAWPEFVTPWDDGAPGPTDMAFLQEKPAGASGFIRIADGHLVSGDGRRWRIWGQNTSFSASLPPIEMAPAFARRLAKFGLNCIRLHHMDHPWPRGVLIRRLKDASESTRALDPEAIARLDYFVWCCKENGIYVDLNLNVSRPFTAADGVTQVEWIGYGKALTYFDPQLIALQKEYAAQLLGHVNPFTGNRYAEEPAVALVEMVNENSVVNAWLADRLRGEQTEPGSTWCDIPPAYAENLDKMWREWLVRRYRDRAALSSAWGGEIPEEVDPWYRTVHRLRRGEFDSASAGRFADEALFYAELEVAFFGEMEHFLRNEVGVRQIIVGSSDHSHSINGQLHVRSNSVLGITDGHCYWQHPRRGQGADGRREWSISNTPMLDAPDHSAPAQLSRTRVKGMPMIVTETNQPFPNDYRAEFVPILAAYGLLQDWDGVFLYSYAHSPDALRGGAITGNFDTSCDPVMMAQSALGALVFRRGDVRAAQRLVERRLTGERVIECMRSKPDDMHPYALPHLRGRLALVHGTAIAAFEAEALSPGEDEIALPEGVITSDTGELAWEEGVGESRLRVNTPRYQAIVGHAAPRSTDNLSVDLSTGFASVQLASLTELPIALTDRMLLVVAARAANTGMGWTDEGRTSLANRWGGPPTRIEPVAGTLRLHDLERATSVVLSPLDGRGQPTASRELTSSDGSWEIRLPSEPATLWYLVEVRRGGSS